jgi:hypothetical protein
VKKVDQPEVTEIRSWGAHERVAVKRKDGPGCATERGRFARCAPRGWVCNRDTAGSRSGHVLGLRKRYRVLASTGRAACETVRAPGGPTECHQLVIEAGSGYWVVPAIYQPTGSYIGATTAAECAEMDKTQGRDFALSTGHASP